MHSATVSVSPNCMAPLQIWILIADAPTIVNGTRKCLVIKTDAVVLQLAYVQTQMAMKSAGQTLIPIWGVTNTPQISGLFSPNLNGCVTMNAVNLLLTIKSNAPMKLTGALFFSYLSCR